MNLWCLIARYRYRFYFIVSAVVISIAITAKHHSESDRKERCKDAGDKKVMLDY